MASVVIILTHSLYSQIPLPVLFFRSVYSDNSLGQLSLILLIFNTFNFLINIFIPYSFETVFYLFISACRVKTSLASCYHCLSSEKRNALIHLPPAFSFLARQYILMLLTLLTRLQLLKAGSCM